MSPAVTRRLLWAILGGALALRLWGLNFGLPHIYLTDEWFEVKRALKLGAGVFDMDRVGKGGYYYLLFVVFGAFYAVQRVIGSVSNANDFLLSIFRDPTGLWLAGRGATAVLGTLNVWLIYRAGVGLRDRAVGLLAAAMMAIFMLHVRSSHSITVDVPLVCLLTLGFALVYGWQRRDDLGVRHYAILGVVSAIAAATKLPGAVFSICVLLMHARLFRRGSRGAVLGYLLDPRLWAYLGVGAVLYTAIEPGIVFKIGDILRMLLSFVMPQDAVAAGDLPYPILPGRYSSMHAFYAVSLFPLAYTILPLLFVVGAALSIWRAGVLRHSALVFAVVFAAFLLSSKNPHLIYARYVLPIVPVVLLYSAFALVELHRKLATVRTLRSWLAPALGLLVMVPMLADTVRLDRAYGYPDTRTAAKDWVEAHVPAGASIFIAGGLVKASSLTAQLKLMPELVDARVSGRLSETDAEMTGEKSQYYEMYKRALAEYEPTYDLIFLDEEVQLRQTLLAGRGEWALLVDDARVLFDHESNREAFPERWMLIERVESGGYEVVQRFPRQEGWIGPSLTLYKQTERVEVDP